MSVITAVVVGVFSANAFHETFNRAQTAYAEERFADAVAAYEQLVGERVHDAAVFYNLGNAYLRLGETGLAIGNYERALQADPTMLEAQTNLTLAVRETQRQLPRPRAPEWEQAVLFWHANLTPGAARALALVVWVAFWALMALRQWRRFPYARTVLAAAAVLAAATTASAWVKSNPVALAVAIDAAVPVRHGTHEEDGIRFELHRGDRVVVEDRVVAGEPREEWVRVRVTTDTETARGWAKAEALMAVGPPYRAAPPGLLDRLGTEPEPG